jgi:hypothetical protein
VFRVFLVAQRNDCRGPAFLASAPRYTRHVFWASNRFLAARERQAPKGGSIVTNVRPHTTSSNREAALRFVAQNHHEIRIIAGF